MSKDRTRNLEAEFDAQEIHTRDIGRCRSCNQLKPVNSAHVCGNCQLEKEINGETTTTN